MAMMPMKTTTMMINQVGFTVLMRDSMICRQEHRHIHRDDDAEAEDERVGLQAAGLQAAKPFAKTGGQRGGQPRGGAVHKYFLQRVDNPREAVLCVFHQRGVD